MGDKKDFRNLKLKMRVKKIINSSKCKNFIKSHVISYDETPVELEHHKGNITAYKN